MTPIDDVPNPFAPGSIIHHLLDVITHLTSTLDLDMVLTAMLDDTVVLADAHGGTLFLLEHELPTHKIAKRGTSRAEVKRDVLHDVLAHGLASWVRDNRRSGRVRDTRIDPRWFHVPGETYEPLSALCVPVMRREEMLGILTVSHVEADHFTDLHEKILEAVARQAAVAIENARLFARVTILSIQDELTGINNRRRFFELAEPEFARARRNAREIAAIMLDIDHFKAVNDTYGHGVGDEVLREVAGRLQRNIRQDNVDVLGRYGGEEFAIVLTDTGREKALETGERLRQAVEEAPVATAKGPVQVTISVGTAEVTPESSSLTSLLNAADNNLYEAKREGRNRVK